MYPARVQGKYRTGRDPDRYPSMFVERSGYDSWMDVDGRSFSRTSIGETMHIVTVLAACVRRFDRGWIRFVDRRHGTTILGATRTRRLVSGVTEQFADKFAPPPNADNLNEEICKCYYTLSRKCLTTTTTTTMTTMLNSRMDGWRNGWNVAEVVGILSHNGILGDGRVNI